MASPGDAAAAAARAACEGSAIAGIGVDVVDLARFERILARTPRLLERVFAERERGLSARSLAARFAAREAAMKAIGGLGEPGDPDALALRDFEVERGPDGAPAFARGPRLARALERRGIGALRCSLAHDGPVAIAFVVAERLPPRPSGRGRASA